MFNKRTYTTPNGTYYNLYADMLKQPHLLIAGTTGSGKSVVINGIITTALYNSPGKAQFVFIDPKRVELSEYRNIPHCLKYASEPEDIRQALDYTMSVIESRYKSMQAAGQRKYTGSDIYVIIDELADLMTTDKKHVLPVLQRIGQIGRAANVHIIAGTQTPVVQVLPTVLKVNFDSRVALRTRSGQDSRNITGFSGCECLPKYGQGYYMTPDGTTLYNIPMITDSERQRIIEHWTRQNRPFLGFRKGA